MRAYRSKWFNAYNDKNKPSLKILNKKFNTGVYFIKNKNTGKIVYIGFSSSQLYKTIYRHFQKWTDSRHRRVYPKSGYMIRVIFCPAKRAADLEKYLVNKFKPVDNTIYYEDANFIKSSTLMDDNKPLFVGPDDEAPF